MRKYTKSDYLENKFCPGKLLDLNDNFKKLLKNYFQNRPWQYIEPKLEKLLEEELDFSRIENTFYNNNSIRLVKKMIIGIVQSRVKDELQDNTIESISSFLLKSCFDMIMITMAERLAKSATMHIGSSEQFLRYYDGGIAKLHSGTNMRKPALKDATDNPLTPFFIMTLVMQYQQELNKVFSLELQLMPYEEAVKLHKARLNVIEGNVEKLEENKYELIKKTEEFTASSDAKKSELKELKSKIAHISKKILPPIQKKVKKHGKETQKIYTDAKLFLEKSTLLVKHQT